MTHSTQSKRAAELKLQGEPPLKFPRTAENEHRKQLNWRGRAEVDLVSPGIFRVAHPNTTRLASHDADYFSAKSWRWKSRVLEVKLEPLRSTHFWPLYGELRFHIASGQWRAVQDKWEVPVWDLGEHLGWKTVILHPEIRHARLLSGQDLHDLSDQVGQEIWDALRYRLNHSLVRIMVGYLDLPMDILFSDAVFLC